MFGGSNPSDGIIFPNILKKKFQTTNQIDIYIYIYLKPDKEIKESGHIATKGLHEPSNPAVAKVNLNPSARA